MYANSPQKKAKFVTGKNNVARLNNKTYVVIHDEPHQAHLENPDPAKCSIFVDGKKYPLIFGGHTLCEDLKYRKSAKDSLGFFGPYSAFKVEDPGISTKKVEL